MATELSKKSEETEEGEIIDDDDDDGDGNFNINDLEAISDSSLPPAGKCDTSKDYIQVISSSSLSETDLSHREYFRKKHHKRKHCKFVKKKKLHHHFHRRHHHHHKRHHHRHQDSSSSYSNDNNDAYCHISDTSSISSGDEYMMLNKSLLKAAVHVNNSVLHKNSLQSRLKAMTLINETSTDIQNQIVDSIERQVNKEENSKDDDYELIELRLAALQTAILNKKNLRKKRKMIEMEEAEENKEKETGKLDTSETEIITNLEKKPCLEIEPETEPDKKNNGGIETSLDEDEDVLRALLLASMAKKITKQPSKMTNKPTKVTHTNNFQQITYDTKKTIDNPKIGMPHHEQKLNSKINGNRNLIPQIFTSTTNKINNVILSKKLVKTAPTVVTPAQVHTKVKPIIIQLNNDSDSDDADVSKTKIATVKEQPKVKSIESTVEKFLKEQKAKRESEMAKKKESNESNIFEKSCVKLLPKSKQIEYQILVQRLKNAQKRPQKLKKPQSKPVKNECISVVNNSKKIVRNKFHTSKQTENKMSNGGGDQVEIPDLVEDARRLQKAIKEMQSKTSRRLQMQEKYTILTPIVKKINEASIERKKCDKEIKRLQEALAEAMTNLRQTHLNFKESVKELIEKKAEIDKKSSPTKQLPVTSTPLKEKSSVPFENSPASTILSGTTDNSSNKENLNLNDKSNLISTEMTEDRNFGDPNDIDKIYDIVPKYISPLDSNNRSNVDDPFTIMCPYDINGNCRDPECKYKHYRE